MKKILLLFLLLCAAQANAQKQNIDVDLLSDVISGKQEEVKKRILSNIVVNNLHYSNYTTFNTLYNLVDIITTEKNKAVMTKNIIQQIATYSLVVGLTDYYLKKYTNINKDIEKLQLLGIRSQLPLSEQRGIESIAGDAYKSTDKKSKMLEVESPISSKKEFGKIMNSKLVNVLIDSAYKILSSDPTFLKRGFFIQNEKRPYFNNGLVLDTNGFSDFFKDKLPILLSNFKDFLNTCTSLSDQTDSLIQFVSEEKIQFNDIGNTKLKREHVALLMYVFNKTISIYRNKMGENSFIAYIGDLISNYVILDISKNDSDATNYDFKIDVEAIILTLEEKFCTVNISNIVKHRVGCKPFFSIGLNYGHFINKNTSFNLETGTKRIDQIVLAGERIGIKFIFADYRYLTNHAPFEWFKYKKKYYRWKCPAKKPLINNTYLSLFASGLMYNIFDLRSESNFKYVTTGIGYGLEFFNGLECNLSFVIPIVNRSHLNHMFEKGFINFGMDVPIFEYIKAARTKRG